jgi:hypothetical protein
MGGVKRAFISDRCPWSHVYNDGVATHYLAAYGLVERWREWPPGRRDPRLLEAMTVIASEHQAVDREKYAPKK